MHSARVRSRAWCFASAKASLATAAEDGNALEADMVGLLQAKNGFMVNLAVFKTQDRMVGALLDTRS